MQVSEVGSALSSRLNDEQKFIIWVWEMLPRFHLHHCDMAVLPADIIASDMGNQVPELHKCAGLQHLQHGIAAKQSVACYAALMLTTFGHR